MLHIWKTLDMIDLLIPCYNEDSNVKTLVEQWKTIVLENQNIMVHFIDNGSTDNTLKVLINEISKANLKNLNLIKVPRNKGYGFGIKYGISATNNKYICWTHADLQISATDVQSLIKKFLLSEDKDNHIYMGKRQNRKTLDLFFTTMMSVITFICSGFYFKDINAQPKIFARSLVENLENLPDDFNLDLALLITSKKAGYGIKLFDLIFHSRAFNLAKGGGSFRGKIILSFSTLSYLFANISFLKK